MDRPTVILIAGPTASGKSALALSVAEQLGGVVVNADSMQVYRDLRVITARPSPEEEARAPHRLYGYVDAADQLFRRAMVRDVDEVHARTQVAKAHRRFWSAAPGFISRR